MDEESEVLKWGQRNDVEKVREKTQEKGVKDAQQPRTICSFVLMMDDGMIE